MSSTHDGKGKIYCLYNRRKFSLSEMFSKSDTTETKHDTKDIMTALFSLSVISKIEIVFLKIILNKPLKQRP